jgi:hypothetical protein
MDDQEFRDHVVGSLERIETGLSYTQDRLADHIEDDEELFSRIVDDLKEIEISAAVAKAAGGKAGGRWGAGIAAGFLGLFELWRSWW